MRILIIGRTGQIATELLARLPEAAALEPPDLDLTDAASIAAALARFRPEAIINAAAYTAVDRAETHQGRTEAWASNVSGVSQLVKVCAQHDLTLVHISSEYVFDGSAQGAYSETAPVNPLGVYSETKAAGDAMVGTLPKHYILRTSWLIGDGSNFVRTMAGLADRGIDPSVVSDQRGRLTFAPDLAGAILHLLSAQPAFGIYNLTNEGAATSWFEVAQSVFEATGHDPARVKPVTTDEYFADHVAAGQAIAPRPLNSLLDLSKIEATGFVPRNAMYALQQYLTES
jgi:dTDP-4-dehydrorhamnose 3,5-epimerase